MLDTYNGILRRWREISLGRAMCRALRRAMCRAMRRAMRRAMVRITRPHRLW